MCGLSSGPHLDPKKAPPSGTPGYMAPEIFRTFWTQILADALLSPYDAIKADAWGVGAILYYAATGQHLLPDQPASASSTAAAPLSSNRCSSTSNICAGTDKTAGNNSHSSNGHSSASSTDALADMYIETWEWVQQWHSTWQVRPQQAVPISKHWVTSQGRDTGM